MPSAKSAKAERKLNSRDQVRLIQQQQAAKEKRRSLLLKLAAVILPIIVLGIVLAVIISTNKATTTEVTKPANSTERGILVGQDKEVLTEVPTEPVGEKETAPAHVVIYQDYICPACKSFESSFASEIDTMIEDGSAVVEYRTVTFLDSMSAGSNYSSRAANASYCVANSKPENFFDFNNVLYANQPAEGTKGLTNDQLVALANSVGATGLDDCIKDGTHRGWAAENNDLALEIPIEGTPTILINGSEWDKQGSLYEAVNAASSGETAESTESPEPAASETAS